MDRRVAYVAPNDRHRILFEGALNPLGYAGLVHFQTLDSALESIKHNDAYRLVMLHGPLAGVTPSDALVSAIRAKARIPVLVLNHDGPWTGAAYSDVEVLPAPVTAASVAEAAARLRRVNHGKLVDRLLRSPGFEKFSEDALAYLLGQSRAVQLQDGDVLFDKGASGDTMYFVLAGEITIHLGGREVERVQAGGILGEMAMLEGRIRSARASATDTTVLLELEARGIERADMAFRAILFELITRTLILRLRRSDSVIWELDGHSSDADE